MAYQYFVKAARTDIYLVGKEVWRTRKTGKSKGLPYMVRDHSKPKDSTDKLICYKGESYYWCKFRSDIGKRVSKTPFTFEQLKYGRYGKPEWETYWDDFYQRFSESSGDEKEELVTEIEEYRDELQNRLSNMPEQLQESSVLNERIELLDNLITDLE